MPQDSKRNLRLDKAIAESRRLWGFGTCPSCGTVHTAKTVMCRLCGYNGRTKVKPGEMRAQKYWACQLVAAINARIVLGGADVTDEEFERLVDLVQCRRGAPIHSERIYPELGLQTEEGPVEKDWIANHLPVELHIWSLPYGFHVVLVYGEANGMFHVHNADAIKPYGWFDWDHLKALADRNIFTRKSGLCKSFRLSVRCNA